MRILVVPKGVFPVPGRGGVDNHAYMLACGLSQLGHEVHLVADPSEDFQVLPNLLLHPLSLPHLPTSNINWWAIIQTVAAVYTFCVARDVIRNASAPFDIIHTHGPLAGLLISMSYPEIPIVHTVHDPTPYMCFYESRYERFLRKVHFRLIDLTTYRKVDRIITVGRAIRDELVRWGITPEKIEVIPNGVSAELLNSGSENVPNLPFRNFCLFVGSLTPRKGVSYLLEALAGVDGVNSVIVGDGREMGALKHQARALGLAERVHFTGALPQRVVSSMYSMADFLVLPSLAEGLPLVIIEAMACGLPVIATRISGVTDIVIDKWNGLLIEPRSVDELRQGIITLRDNPDLRAMMSANAKQTISEAYTWAAVTRRTVEEYDKVLAMTTGNATTVGSVY